jgi:hypothetical protein
MQGVWGAQRPQRGSRGLAPWAGRGAQRPQKAGAQRPQKAGARAYAAETRRTGRFRSDLRVQPIACTA